MGVRHKGGMISCPVCGFQNVNSTARCLKCNALLRGDEAELRAAFIRADERRDEPRLLMVRGALQKLWSRNPLRRFWRLPEDARYRFPFTAGLLSLLPGLGQIYNRQSGKALLLAGAWWGGAVLNLAALRHPFSNVLLLLLLLGWLLIWNDAIASAARMNGQFWSLRNSVALWFAAMFATGVLISASQFLGRNHISLVRVLDRAQKPDLHFGDLVLTNHMAYWFSGPQIGEVVYFDPERFAAEQTGALLNSSVSINVTDYFQRITALPGDRVEKREGRILRNGVVLPENLQPFGAELIPDGQTFQVPPGHYWLPVTRFPSDVLGALVNAPRLNLFQSGWIFPGWHESTMVPAGNIRGKAVAVINPPERRRWLTAK